MVEIHRDSSVDTTTRCMRCPAQIIHREAPLLAQGNSAPSQVFHQQNNPHNHREISTTSTSASSLEGRLGCLAARLRAAGQHLAGALLHAHLALHLLHLLLLAERQRPGDAEQKRAGADDPEGFAAEAQARGRPVVGCVGGRRQLLAVGRGHDVGERGDAVCEGFVVVVVVLDADVAGVGLCEDGGQSCEGDVGGARDGCFSPESESLIQASSPVCWVLKCSSSTSSSLTIVAVVCG